MLKIGINKDISNSQYHGDTSFISSSGLKMLLKDPAEYYKRFILREKEEPRNIGALNLGTAAHTMILEPHLAETIAVYPGPMRRGKAYEEFVAANAEKTILTESENRKLGLLMEAYNNNQQAMAMIAGCEFEYTIASVIDYVPVKIRADAINIEAGYVVDVKTTSYPGDRESFAQVVQDLYYDLSAALYLAVVKQYFKREFDFYFLVLSKNENSCTLFKLSEESKIKGIAKLEKSLATLKYCQLTGKWEHETIESDGDETIEEV